MSQPPPVALDGVAVRYPNGTWALDGIDWRLDAGRVAAVVGPNGSGKSTLLGLLSGRLRPTRGTLRLWGTAPPPAWPRSLRQRVAYIAQDPALDPEMSVGETCAYFAALYGLGTAAGRRDAAALLAALALHDHLDARIARLSGGQRGRLHVAVGLLQPAELYLLDEPDAALDDAGRTALWALLGARAAAGAAVVVVSHHGDVAQAKAHTVLTLSGGHVGDAAAPGNGTASDAPHRGGSRSRERGPGRGGTR